MRERSGRMPSFIEKRGGYNLRSFVKHPCYNHKGDFFFFLPDAIIELGCSTSPKLQEIWITTSSERPKHAKHQLTDDNRRDAAGHRSTVLYPLQTEKEL